MNQLRKLAGRVFADLGRARVTPRQALIYERLIRVTLARGRQAVRIPRLEMFGRFKLTKGNVSEALNGFEVADDSQSAIANSQSRRRVPGLVELGMLQVAPSVDGGLVVTVLPDATQWRCEWRFEQAADDSFLAELDAVAGQVQGELLPAEMSLKEALAETSAQNAARSRIGNGMTPRVPESGTVRTGVSGTGTPVTQASERAGLTGVPVTLNEQDLMDRLERFLSSSPHEEDRNDFAHWNGFWRMKVVRPNPGLLARVLTDLESRQKEGWEASRSRVGAIKYYLKEWK